MEAFAVSASRQRTSPRARQGAQALVLAGACWHCLLAGPATADDVRVVATINPVHSLVSGVMAGVGEPHLIVRGSVSPHSFSLRPSDAEMLEQAEVVFLIGEAMETSIAGPIDTLADDARVVELSEADGLVRRPLREGGDFEEEVEHDHHVDPDHEHEAFDMHVWLDPLNAQAMVRAIADTLSEVHPAGAETYTANAASLQQRLTDLTTEIAAELAPVQGEPFIVFHDGYRYFEDRFGVVAAGSAIVSADRSPGVRRIRELQEKVRDLGVRCVMTEPQFEARLVDVIVEGTTARTGSADPLGASIETGPELYFTLLRNLASSFKDCLASG